MAAADPRQRGHQRFKDSNRIFIIALCKGADAATKFDGGWTRSQPAVGVESFQFRQPCFESCAARCCCDEGVVYIGEVNSRLGKESIAIAGNIPPIWFQTGFAG